MRSTMVFLLCFLLLGSVSAETKKLDIKHATVFLQGAELSSTAKISLQKGENEVIFTNVAGNVNDKTIVVKTTNGVAVQQVTFKNNYLNTDNVSPVVKQLKDTIELVNAQRQPINNRIGVLNEQIAIIQTNRKVNGEHTGLNTAELQKLLDFVNTKLETYLNEKNKQENSIKKIDERIARLQHQLEEEQQKEYQPGGMLVVEFYAKEATTSDVEVTYVVPSAGWSPVYDISADNTAGPMTFYYKANIYQNSGVKWDNVKLTISTGNPTEGMQAPALNPWYVQFYVPQHTKFKTKMTTVGVVANAPQAPAAYLDYADLKGTVNTMEEYTTVDNSGVNTEYDIEVPYTIPADGQKHLVAVKKYEKPAIYSYYAAPKLDKDAFLQAKVTDWEDLNLLPGETNIFYEGTFLGNGYIDPKAVTDTLAISLGRDKKVVLKRELDKKMRSVKTIGTNVREQFAYNITVRNTRKETVTLEVQDQQPVTTDKDIVIEDQELGGATYDEATGKMTWLITLKPNETRKLSFGYTLKYPRGKTIANK